jgi:hypothetical protein
MRALSCVTSLWPGLAALWLRGRWTGLATAAGFAVVLNSALVATFADLPAPAGLPWAIPAAAWLLVLGFWVLGFR